MLCLRLLLVASIHMWQMREEFPIRFADDCFVVTTDIPEFASFLKRSYGPRIAACSRPPLGSMSITRLDSSSFEISGTQVLRIEHQSPDMQFQYLKHEILAAFMRARPDLLWIHASAVERNGKAILLAGPSGVGKSTLSLGLCESGWRILSDDVAPISMSEDLVLPFFQGATRRVNPGMFVDEKKARVLQRDEIQIPLESVCLDSAEFVAIVLPEFDSSSGARLAQVEGGSASLELIRNTTNFADHRDEGVRRARDICVTMPVFRLSYGSIKPAIDALKDLAASVESLRDSV